MDIFVFQSDSGGSRVEFFLGSWEIGIGYYCQKLVVFFELLDEGIRLSKF